MYLIHTKKDKKRALEIFNDAFIDSLGIMWVLKRKTLNSKKLTIKVLFHEGIDKKGAYLTEDKNGALLFFDNNNTRTSLNNIIRKIWLVIIYAGFVNAYRLIKYRELISATRPKGVLIGFLVATDQNMIGNAAAFEIKNQMFAIAKNLKKTICLETSIPRVRRLYKLSGYTEYAEIKHPYEDLTIWFFKKEY